PPGGTPVTLGGANSGFNQALIRAKGHIDLGISEVTLHSNFLFESATDSHGANVIKIGLTVLTLSLGDFLNIGPASGLIVITSTGFAAKFTVPLAFTFGNPTAPNGTGVAFNANVSLAINTTPGPVDVTVGTDHLVLTEAGPYLRIEADSVNLNVAVLGVAASLRGNFAFEQITGNNVKLIRMGGSGVCLASGNAW